MDTVCGSGKKILFGEQWFVDYYDYDLLLHWLCSLLIIIIITITTATAT